SAPHFLALTARSNSKSRPLRAGDSDAGLGAWRRDRRCEALVYEERRVHREHGDRRDPRHSESARGSVRRAELAGGDQMSVDGVGDVLELLAAEVDEGLVQLAVLLLRC